MYILIIGSLLANIKLESCVTSFSIDVSIIYSMIDHDATILSIDKPDGVFVATLVDPSYVGTITLGMIISPDYPYAVYSKTVEIDNSMCNFGTTSGGFQAISLRWLLLNAINQ